MTAIIRSRPQGSALSVCQATVLTLNLLQLTIVVPVVQDNLCPFHLENSGGYSRGLQQSLVSHCQIGVCDWIFMFFCCFGVLCFVFSFLLFLFWAFKCCLCSVFILSNSPIHLWISRCHLHLQRDASEKLVIIPGVMVCLVLAILLCLQATESGDFLWCFFQQ